MVGHCGRRGAHQSIAVGVFLLRCGLALCQAVLDSWTLWIEWKCRLGIESVVWWRFRWCFQRYMSFLDLNAVDNMCFGFGCAWQAVSIFP